MVQAGYTIRIRGHRIYTSLGFALGRVYPITPHPHCIIYTWPRPHILYSGYRPRPWTIAYTYSITFIIMYERATSNMFNRLQNR